jgi:nucleoside-diphosphate-sugar epimerase
MRIFLTGGTGFIGSHLARALVLAGHALVVLRREQSDLSRCLDFAEEVHWLSQDAPDWIRQAELTRPQIIIHSAWAGVGAADRDNWKLQATNLVLFADLLELAERVALSRFLAFGSQAEYGPIAGRINEEHPCQPDTAYGATKLACLALLQGWARRKNLPYVWLRLFSIYGPGEGEQWFISSLIRQMQLGQTPQLSGCEQQYDYLHVQDLAAGLLAVLRTPGPGGVFNLSSNTARPLKQVVRLVQEHTGCRTEPAFGALPYRPGQSMHMEGDSTRFYNTFAFQPRIDLNEGLRQLVQANSMSPARR